MIYCFGATDVGLRRKLNEDTLYFDEDSGLFVVADGMGGHNAGEVASHLAAETVANFINRSIGEEEITWPYGVDPKLSLDANRLQTALMLANKRVWKEAELRQEYTGMGTTIVAAIVTDDHISFVGAGDSRIYRVREERLEQLTCDDSWVQVALTEGVLKPEEIEHHPMKNIITKAVGAKESITVKPLEERLENDDILLMCTDGLHGMVRDEKILEIILAAQSEPEKCVRDRIAAAYDNGAKDNVTVLVLLHREMDNTEVFS